MSFWGLSKCVKAQGAKAKVVVWSYGVVQRGRGKERRYYVKVEAVKVDGGREREGVGMEAERN